MSAMKPIRAIEDFLPDGNFSRALIFEDEKGNSETIVFPDNSMAIIRGDRELYDWYGRKVEIPNDVERIIRHYGSEIRESTGPAKAKVHELFLVQKKNGNLTIAHLVDKVIKNCTGLKIPPYKQTAVNFTENLSPKLDTDYQEFIKINDEFSQNPIVKAFISHFPSYIKHAKVDLIIGADPKSVFTQLEFRLTDSFFCFDNDSKRKSPFITHRIAETRDSIFNHLTGYAETTTLVNEVSISEDGKKLTTIFKHGNGEYYRISTDMEVVNHMGKFQSDSDGQSFLYWYLDPL